MCDLCFKPIFDREFYIFPCNHSFHRMCIYTKIANYTTKDPRMRIIVEGVKRCFGEINAIRSIAEMAAQ